MSKQPIAELFGFPVDNESTEAERHRENRRCPYNNKIPNCTKDSTTNPLGICSIFQGDNLAVICPVRLRQDWLIADHAAAFFFPTGSRWTTLVEVRLKDSHGGSAGNIDVVLVSYDEHGQITDFGSLEVQTVYISGYSVRRGYFEPLMANRAEYLAIDWEASRRNSPRADYLSSSRKRLAPQLIYKGGILKAWGKKQAVAVHSAFFNKLPTLPEVPKDKADIAWFIYDLVHDEQEHRYNLALTRTVYTEFKASLDKITLSEPGPMNGFIGQLQTKLDAKLGGTGVADLSDAPDALADEPDLEEELENL
ncbi:MAG TPA: NotI family restriction endonuclease [Blastocatellia bacterium]